MTSNNVKNDVICLYQCAVKKLLTHSLSSQYRSDVGPPDVVMYISLNEATYTVYTQLVWED